MRRLIPALILTVTVLGLGTPAALAGGKAPAVSPQACLTLPELKIPKVNLPDACTIKAGVQDLAVKLNASASAVLHGLLQLAAKVGATLPAVLNLTVGVAAALPPLAASLLCLDR